MRITTFALFVLLIATSIIEWSPRWYAFAALLLIWALLGAIALVRNDRDNAAFRIGAVIKKAVLALLAVLLALSPALVFPQYRPLKTTGAYGVETASYTYTDESCAEAYSDTGRHRSLAVQYWYPEVADGK